ncbi:methyl-accepting chemotaxis protein [Janthinobacterium agaricidamnosum]|uniref:Methyl-accepting chemotaxis (MCP) signaling domain protein n=1 Tax=Janthinobacterium agaricidamnosum NBRC 102515 = DSM 9628 TaxID=1349767 RepID=W0V8G9_9BURK|nr:methyl-accepting chemotaxis protein [Janthinobacterium agaricidamnosum]CDG83557.1 methyl-accepting chemotaxis (MCP) signaling domain protein [Janthinobacterium agaricidamnosum NBRC 102515 = DSM 9628]
MLNRMKVGTRLIAAFSCVALLGAIVAGIGIVNMAKIDTMAARMYNNELLGLSHIKEANISLAKTGRARSNYLLATSEEERSQHKASIDKSLAVNKDSIAKALPLFTSDASKQVFARFTVVAADYENVMNQALLLAAKEPMQQRDAELDALLTETRKHADALDQMLDQLSIQKEERARSAADEAASVYQTSRTFMLLLVLGSVAAGLTLGVLITRGLTHQLGGEPAYASHIAGAIAGGDLTVAIDTHAGDHDSLLFAMKTMRDKLVGIVSQVRAGTDTIATASGEIASGNMDLSSRTEEQASSLEETASSMEQLTATVRQNADNAREANQLAASASQVASKGGAVVGQVVQTMETINASSRKIVDIISVIDGIAFQTNILALNAAVEAARAGEQGRGFAVVATEVRNLAQRSAAAAKDIKVLIGDSVEQVEIGAKLVHEAGDTMNEVVGSVQRVAHIMSDITSASQEQSAGIEQVNQAITQMDQVTQQNAALVEQAAAAASSLQDQAAALTGVVSIFKLHAPSASSGQAFAQDKVTPMRRPAASSGPRRIALSLSDAA